MMDEHYYNVYSKRVSLQVIMNKIKYGEGTETLNQILFCVLSHPILIHTDTTPFQMQKPVSRIARTLDSFLVKKLQALTMQLSGTFYLNRTARLKFPVRK